MEEPDMDIEYSAVRSEVPSTKKFIPSEGNSHMRTNGNSASLPAPSGWVTANSKSQVDTTTTSNTSTPQSTTETAPERKKRKYERHAVKVNADNESRASPASGKETSLPGMSQFSTAHNGASEAPPAKKRKTVNGQSTHSPSSATPPTVSVPTITQPTRLALPVSGVVSFEKSGYRLNNKEQLVADDGDTYAVDGELA